MMALIHQINDASDAIAEARDFTWAIFFALQGNGQDRRANALATCCNQVLTKLAESAEILDAVTEQEREKSREADHAA